MTTTQIASHTPGPWHISDGPKSLAIFIGSPNSEVAIALVTRKLDPLFAAQDSPAAEANAHLIAASPELYRELAHLVRLLEPKESDGFLDVPGLATLNGARAALAKASPQPAG